jgi:aminoglycoside phosphotransferase (APT) family kinase protein
MEGAVYRASDTTVAKVWFHQSEASVHALADYYAAVRDLRFTFHTPEITNVTVVGDTVISEERYLSGVTLKEYADVTDEAIAPAAKQALDEILRSLSSTPVPTVPPTIPMLGEAIDGVDAGNGLGRYVHLAERRFQKYGHLLRNRVPNVDALAAEVSADVSTLPVAPAVVVHGDICAENILVDADGKLTALIDWGFLSSAGHPVFDLAVAASIYDMYGAHAAKHRQQLMAWASDSFHVNRADLEVVLALYSILTSNAYSEDGAEGHFEWCVSYLQSFARSRAGS